MKATTLNGSITVMLLLVCIMAAMVNLPLWFTVGLLVTALLGFVANRFILRTFFKGD
jgi:hypothetical protein